MAPSQAPSAFESDKESQSAADSHSASEDLLRESARDRDGTVRSCAADNLLEQAPLLFLIMQPS